MIATCPSQDQLRSLTLGELSEEKSDALIIHIEGCGNCQTELGTLDDSADTFIHTLRGANKPDDNEPMFDDEQEQRIASTRALAALALAESRDASDLAVPKVIGEYEIVRQLGHGGMGHVYLGQHTKLGRKVAIKFLANHRRWDKTMHERFSAEMRTIGGLDHANIVSAHDAREVDGTAVLVTEFIDGLDVSDLLRRLGPMSLANAVAIVVEVCNALHYCDHQGLVHRDVKPSNIMIGKDGTVKLLDLGLARLQGSGEQNEFTATGQAMGTADYVAPEQINDGKNVDIRTDIYGLGCTLYKMLTGHAPFAKPQYPTAFAKMNAHISDEPQRIEELRDDLPKPAVDLVHQMLEKSPKNRPQDLEQVIECLVPLKQDTDLPSLVAQALISDKPILVEPKPGGQRKKFPARHPSFASRIPWIPMVAAGFAALLFGMWLGVVITVKKPDGTTAKVVIPDGATAIVDQQGNIEIRLGDQTHRIVKEQVEIKQSTAEPTSDETIAANKSLVIAGVRPGELFTYETGTDLDSHRLLYQIDKTSPFYNRFEDRDLVDLQVFPKRELGESVLFSKIGLAQVSKSSHLQQLEIQILNDKKGQVFKLMQAGASFLVDFHKPKRQALVDAVRIEGAWRVLVRRVYKVTDPIDADDCYLFYRGRFIQIDKTKVIASSSYEVGLDSTLQSSEGKVRYRFLESGKLEIGINNDGQLPDSFDGADVFFRLQRVDIPQCDAEKIALELIDSASKAEKKVEFAIVDQKTGKKTLPAAITNSDILSAEVDGTKNSISILLKLTAGAGNRLRRTTSLNLGNKLLISIDGKEICSPVINAAVGSPCAISGNFTREEAQKIADSIVPRMNLEKWGLAGHAMRMDSIANLKTLGSGIGKLETAMKSFPASASIPFDHPVSWRVQILPSIGHSDLYRQYRQNEPWDSEHNLKLLKKMPDVFRHPSSPIGSTTTDYIGLVGSETAMGLRKGIQIRQITDGTSATLMLVESQTDIPWTKPADLNCDDVDINSLDLIRPFEKNKILASLCDGSAVTLDRTKVNASRWNMLTNRSDASNLAIDEVRYEERLLSTEQQKIP